MKLRKPRSRFDPLWRAEDFLWHVKKCQTRVLRSCTISPLRSFTRATSHRCLPALRTPPAGLPYVLQAWGPRGLPPLRPPHVAPLTIESEERCPASPSLLGNGGLEGYAQHQARFRGGWGVMARGHSVSPRWPRCLYVPACPRRCLPCSVRRLESTPRASSGGHTPPTRWRCFVRLSHTARFAAASLLPVPQTPSLL